MIQRLSSKLVKHKGKNLHDVLESLDEKNYSQSSDFKNLKDWAYYPSKVKVFNKGSYSIDETLEVNCDVLLTDGKVILNCNSEFIALKFGKGIVDKVSDVVSELPELTNVVNGSGLSKDDVICIFDDRPYSWSSYREYFKAGEFARVVKTSNGFAHLSGGLLDSYKTGSAIYKMHMSRVSVSGEFVINFPTYSAKSCGMVFEQIYDSDFTGLKVTTNNAPYSVQFKKCYNLSGSSQQIVQSSNGSSLLFLEYGLYIVNSQGLVFQGEYSSERHSVTMTGSSGLCSIVNRLNFVNRSGGGIYTTGVGGTAAADFHGNCDRCGYGGYMQGLILGGTDLDLSGSYIDGIPNNQNKSTILASDLKGISFNLSNTTIVGYGDVDSNRGCIDFGGNSGAFSVGCVLDGTINLSGATISTPSNRVFEVRNRGSSINYHINLSGVIFSVSNGAMAFNISPVDGNKPPVSLNLSGMHIPQGATTRVLDSENVDIKGFELYGKVSGTISGGFQSGNSIITLPSYRPSLPKAVLLTQEGLTADTSPRVFAAFRDISSGNVRIAFMTMDNKPVSTDTNVVFNYLLKF